LFPACVPFHHQPNSISSLRLTTMPASDKATFP
jgi:hypothetical protein